jgi:Zn-dependent protease
MYPQPIKIWRISTSDIELRDLAKAWIAISIMFASVVGGSLFSGNFYSSFIVASLTVGTGFLLHELGHKLVAQRYGCFAEFRSFDQMLILGIIMALVSPFLFAAPGAVMIHGKVSKSRNGKISAAGPMVNLVLSVLFLLLVFSGIGGIVRMIAAYGFMINTWLALFNMIPLWMFDGAKIWRWNKAVYFSIVAVCVVFMYLRSYIN